MVQTMSTAELEKRIRNTRLIDLRDREFYYVGHIEGACCLPYTLVKTHAVELFHPNEALVFYDDGRGDTRAESVVRSLNKQGFHNAYVYTEGWSGWDSQHPSALKDTFTQGPV